MAGPATAGSVPSLDFRRLLITIAEPAILLTEIIVVEDAGGDDTVSWLRVALRRPGACSGA